MRLIPLLTLLLPTLPAAAQVARVEVQPDRATLIAGNQLALRVVALDAGGRAVEGRPVRWSAASADAIAVDSAGVVTAFREGVARVTATVDGVSGGAEFLIEPRAPVRIDVVPEQPEIVVGGATLLRAVARTVDGAPLPRAVFTFRSSDDRVATVDPSGVVTGRGEGSAIFAVQTGEVRSEVRVTVVNNRVARLTVNGPVQARTGDVVRLRASAEDRRNLPVANPPVRWAVSGEGADVGSDGAFVAERAGTYLVTAVAGNVAGVHAIRVSPRGTPTRASGMTPPQRAAVPAGVHPSLRTARSVWIEDTLAYIPDSAGAVRVFSLGNPAAPRELGGWQMGSTAGPGVPPIPRTIHDVMVKDGLAFLAFGRDGLAILDVGQGGRGGSPAMPRLVSLLVPMPPADATPETPGTARAVLRHGRYVYLADGAVTGRVLVLDVMNPLEPAAVAEIRLPDGGPVRLWAAEETLYVEAGGKVRAVDVRGELRGDLVGQGR
jgi:hypothetical protein